MSVFTLAPTSSDRLLNAIFRGSIVNPPTTVYFSLGQSGSTLIPAEVAVTRTPVKLNRGVFSGTDSQVYPYQSSGGSAGTVTLRSIVDIYCTGLLTNAYTNPCGMIFDAASAGNLLFVFDLDNTTVANIINGDVVRMGMGARSGNVSDTNMTFLARSTAAASAYVYSMLVDWLFRGFDSLNQIFGTVTYTNVWLTFWDNTTGIEATIPRLGLARTTGNWSAPVDQAAGVNLERKIANANQILFAPCTVAIPNHSCKLQFRMSNIAQSFNDVLYEIDGFNLTLALGGQVQIDAGNLEVVIN